MKLRLGLMISAVVWAVLQLGLLYADDPKILVSATAPVALVVNGVATGGGSIQVDPGDQVCLKDPLHYISEGSRYRFESWRVENQPDSGDVQTPIQILESPTAQCIVPATPGVYIASFVHEVMIQVRSQVREHQRSWWTPRGEVVDLSVPDVIETDDDIRYRFSEWSGGEAPFSPHNRVVALRSVDLTVFWTTEYRVKLENLHGNHDVVSQWHREGSTLVLRALPEIFDAEERRRQTFRRWEVVSGPLAQVKDARNSSSAVVVDAPYHFRAVFDEYFLVEAKNFQGTLLHEWVRAGDSLKLTAPNTVEVSPDEERYVFRSWNGVDNPVETDTYHILVDRPLVMEAVYDRQFKVNLSSPYGGAGDDWYTQGEMALIMVPEEPQSMLFFKRTFDSLLGTGDETPVRDTPTASVPVNGPMNIVATYRSDINTKVLAIVVGLLVVGILAYVGTEWGPRILRFLQDRTAASTKTDYRDNSMAGESAHEGNGNTAQVRRRRVQLPRRVLNRLRRVDS